MRNPRYVLIGVGLGLLALILGGVVALFIYSDSDDAKTSLVIRYFRALSAGDEVAMGELTSPSFESDLDIGSLKRDSYELFDFGTPSEGTIRFLLVADDASGKRRAVLADMSYRKRGLSQRVERIRRIEEGTGLGR